MSRAHGGALLVARSRTPRAPALNTPHAPASKQRERPLLPGGCLSAPCTAQAMCVVVRMGNESCRGSDFACILPFTHRPRPIRKNGIQDGPS